MFKKYIKYISLSLVLILLAGLFTACGSDKIEIGVVIGTTFAEEVETWEKVDEVKLYADDNRTLQELSSGRIDGVVSDKLVGLINIKEGGFDNLKLADGLIYKETIAVAVRQEDDSLRQAVNNALAEIIEDGTYAKISKKYFNKDILEGVKYEKTFPNEKPANDGSLQRVKDAGEIKFAMSGGYPPFNYFTEDDELTGFDVEIGKAVAEKLGVKYIPVTTEWNGILEGLRSDRYDGIFGSMGVTEKRLEVVDFTDPYYYSGAQLIVRKDSKIEGYEELK